MRRANKSAKVHITSDDSFERDDDLPGGSILDQLPAKVQSLLNLLSIPHGQQFDVICALRDVVRVYKKKGSTLAKSVGSKIVSALTGEIGKLVIHSITNDWGSDDGSAKCFHLISKRILKLFPEMTTRKHKVSGKMLIHHACLKSSSTLSPSYVQTLLEVSPSSASSPDSHGALPLHWCMRNRHPSTQVMRLLIESYPEGPRCKDNKGFVPLHWAVHQAQPCLEVVDELISIYPAAVSVPCNTGGLPLHWAVNHDNPSLPVIEILLDHYPDAMKVPCREGWLPLHRCVDRLLPDVEVVRKLAAAYPPALYFPCKHGQTPLHKAIDHASDSFAVASLLTQLDDRSTKIADHDGFLPLHVSLDCGEPDVRTVEMLIAAFPEAARRQTVDGLLPLHLAIGTNVEPSPRICELLLQAFPSSWLHPVVDYVPADETADPSSWQGDWVEVKWTPLSRASERGLVEIVCLMQEICGLEQPVEEEMFDRLGSDLDQDYFLSTIERSNSREALLPVAGDELPVVSSPQAQSPRWLPNARHRARTSSDCRPPKTLTSSRSIDYLHLSSPDQTPVRLRPRVASMSIVRTSPLYGGRVATSSGGSNTTGSEIRRDSNRKARLNKEAAMSAISEADDLFPEDQQDRFEALHMKAESDWPLKAMFMSAQSTASDREVRAIS